MKFAFKRRRLSWLLIGMLLLISIVEIPIIAAGMTSKPAPGDVMIVLGAKLIGSEPSRVLTLRLDEALRLYHEGYANDIIVSGAQGPDEKTTEARAMKLYLMDHGIAPDHIMIEENSFSTYQNLHNSQKIMQEQGWKNTIIVSNTSHMRRALIIAQHLGMSATGAPAPLPDNAYFTAKQYFREGAALLALSVKPTI